jgi:hypothetical protein
MGLTVSSVTVIPHGDTEDLTPLAVTCEIPRTGIRLYDQLVVTTDLDSPSWDPVVIVHDKLTPVTPASAAGNTLILNGAAFNYPEPVPVKFRLIVKGTVPANHTANQTLLDIRQIDQDGTPYAWPSGNFSLPMPGAPPADGAETGTTTVLGAEISTDKDTIPATPAPVAAGSSPAVTGLVPEKTRILPTPLPATPQAAPEPAMPPAVAAIAGIVVLFTRKLSGR